MKTALMKTVLNNIENHPFVWGIVLTLYKGVALMLLWGWFVVAAFKAPPINLAVAIGLAYIASLLTSEQDAYDVAGKNQSLVIASGFVSPTVAIVGGFLVSFFV